MSDSDDDYKVGYKKPPVHSRFQKGHNRSRGAGRKMGSRNLKTDLLEEMAERITLSEGGKPLRLTKQRALLKAMILRGIKGNERAAGRALELLARLTVADDEPNARMPLEEEDLEIIRRSLGLDDDDPDQGGSDDGA